MRERPEENQIYKHFKGNLYQIVSIARHTETDEELVIYKALYGDGMVYARPLEMFMSKVDKGKYPDSISEYRFELQESVINPGLMEFLDSDSYEEKINILGRIHPVIDDDMINAIAVSLDLEIGEGNIEARYEELKACLLTRARFECNRLR